MSALGQKQTCAAQKPVPIANGQRHLVCAEDGTFQKGYAGDDLSGGDAPCWEIVMGSLAVPVMLIGIFGLSVGLSLATYLSASIPPRRSKVSATKSVGSFLKTQRDIIVGPIVVGAPAPIALLAAKLVSHASRK